MQEASGKRIEVQASPQAKNVKRSLKNSERVVV
jgi:hypothetical protein